MLDWHLFLGVFIGVLSRNLGELVFNWFWSRQRVWEVYDAYTGEWLEGRPDPELIEKRLWSGSKIKAFRLNDGTWTKLPYLSSAPGQRIVRLKLVVLDLKEDKEDSRNWAD